ncbi:MAG: DinB family protein [Mucilaginibacter sp.]
MKKITKLFTLLLMVLLAGVAKSQDAGQMIKDWERAKNYTKHYLEAMPEEGYAFKPSPEMRTFAEHMLHFTDADYELAPLAGGLRSPIAPGEAGKSPDKSKAATIKMVLAGYDFVIANIKNMKPEDMQDTVTVFNKYTMTKATLLNKIFEHQTHHRGQTTVYFHLKGIKPPDEELF